MHIQEGTNTTLTTCTKMTEEVDRRHGVNGTSKGVNDEPVQTSAPATSGGRLKFFKDGKFILELVRGCAREGERAGWVSVPRKTFWPPAAAPPTPPTPPHHAPPCASLSLSDDSSLHSSPCASHRDHCWKQPAPRRRRAAHLQLALYYCRPATLHSSAIRALSRRKRRRPLDTTAPPLPHPHPPNGHAASPPRDEDVVDAPAPAPAAARLDDDREKFHMKLKKPYQYHKLRVYKKTGSPFKRKELARTVDRLRERIAALPTLVNAKLASCRQQEHAMVSPRKRILREMERVSLEDQAGKRRARTAAAPALSTTSYPPAPSPSPGAAAGPGPGPSRAHAHPAHNGVPPRRDATVSKNVSSYSIHSLLSMPDESPTRRSPHSHPPSIKTESPSSVRSPDLSPSPDSYRYRYSTLTLGSPGRGAARDSPTPPHPQPAYRAYAPPTSPYGARAWPQPTPAPAPAPAFYRRDEWALAAAAGAGGHAQYVFGYGYGGAPLAYRAHSPAPLWMHYALAPGAPPGPWAPLPHPLLTDHIPKEEPTSDLPLNLSKH